MDRSDPAYDDADIPPKAKLSDAYRDSLRSPAIREALAKRRGAAGKPAEVAGYID